MAAIRPTSGNVNLEHVRHAVLNSKPKSMTIRIRPMSEGDVERCGGICYAAFKGVAEGHGFRPDFPSPERAIQLMHALLANPDVFNVIAEQDGQVIGSNHLVEYDAIRAVGPITVDPNAQAKGAGRMLMEAVIERGKGTQGGKPGRYSFSTGFIQHGFDFALRISRLRCAGAAGIDGRTFGR